jgi:hypothetical protein
MHPGHSLAITATAILLLMSQAGLAQAPDSTHLRGVKVQTDSLRKETCRGGTLSASGLTCSGAKLSARVTAIRRYANRVDSIEVAYLRLAPVVVSPPCATVPGCNVGSPGNAGYAVQLYYNSGAMYEPPSGMDTVTICAVLESQTGARSLAWPPVRIKTLGDSAIFGERGGNPATQMCARALAESGLSDTTKVSVVWAGDWITIGGRRLWRPFPAVP